MAQAEIDRKIVPALSFDHDGWWSDDFSYGGAPRHYQMIPGGGRRHMRIAVQDEGCTVFSKNPDICQVCGPDDGYNPSPINKVTIGPKPTREIAVVELTGVAAGRTHVLVADKDGKVIDGLDVSVKGSRRMTYRLWTLRDLKRRSARTDAQSIRIMEQVAKLYLNQANVWLVQEGVPEWLTIKVDLGDPIEHYDRLVNSLGVWIKLERKSVADFDLVSCWKMGGPLVGNAHQPSAAALCQDYPDEKEYASIYVYGHELAHLFGLDHSPFQRTILAFDGTRGYQMRRSEIDVMNPSGV